MTGPEPESIGTVDDVTEFEYALTGVARPDGSSTSAIRVLAEMRALLESVQTVPIKSAELRSFLDNEAGERRNGRGVSQPIQGESFSSSLSSSGGFVDITPLELLPEPPEIIEVPPDAAPRDSRNFHPDFFLSNTENEPSGTNQLPTDHQTETTAFGVFSQPDSSLAAGLGIVNESTIGIDRAAVPVQHLQPRPPIGSDSDHSGRRPATPILVGAIAVAVAIIVVGIWWANNHASTTTTNLDLTDSDIGTDSVPELGFDEQLSDRTSQESESRENSEPSEASEVTKDLPSVTMGTTIDSTVLSSVSLAPTSSATVPTASTTGTERQTTRPASTTRPVTATTAKQTTTTLRTTTSSPATTLDTTTTQPTTTIAPSTTNQPFAYVGGHVYLDILGGQASQQAAVALYADSNGDGSPEDLIQQVNLASLGSYSFEVNAGCFVVRVVPFSGYELVPGNNDMPVCVDSGVINNGLDSVIRSLSN